MTFNQFKSVIGLAGVDSGESPRAVWWGHLFEWPMVFVSFWILLEWYLDVAGRLTPEYSHFTSLSIWMLFIAETLVLVTLVTDRKHYLKSNWMNIVIIVAAFPFIFKDSYQVMALRAFRLLVLIGLLFHITSALRQLLMRHHLGITLLVCFIIIAMAGITIASLDPAIDTPWDGLWWAWVTITTVGYGDIVPVSAVGKVFACLLIAMGIGLFSMLTASFSAFFVAKDEEVVVEKEQLSLEKLEQLEKKIGALEQKIDRLIERRGEPD